jgi:hypothetical protein
MARRAMTTHRQCRAAPNSVTTHGNSPLNNAGACSAATKCHQRQSYQQARGRMVDSLSVDASDRHPVKRWLVHTQSKNHQAEQTDLHVHACKALHCPCARVTEKPLLVKSTSKIKQIGSIRMVGRCSPWHRSTKGWHRSTKGWNRSTKGWHRSTKG